VKTVFSEHKSHLWHGTIGLCPVINISLGIEYGTHGKDGI